MPSLGRDILPSSECSSLVCLKAYSHSTHRFPPADLDHCTNLINSLPPFIDIQENNEAPPIYFNRNILIGIHPECNKNMSDTRISILDLRAIGSRIRTLRGEVLQEELALKIGISQGQLSKIESGRLAPTLETLVRLANQFGKSLDWIVTGKK